MSSNGRACLCLGSQQNAKGIILRMRPTMRAATVLCVKAVAVTVGIPGANAPGMGGGRLKLPRPSPAFFEHFRGFECFSFRR
jgi:hypothetical protein